MKKLHSAVVLFTALCTILLPVIALATPITVGEPWNSGSWSQEFNESGVGTFDKIEVFSVSGNAFRDPGIENIHASGWTGLLVNPTYALGTGPLVDNTNFDIHFLGSQSDALVFDFLAWRGSTLLERAQATWSGSGWSFAPLRIDGSGPEDYDRDRVPVPEPATMLLLGLGLVGIAGIRKKFKK